MSLNLAVMLTESAKKDPGHLAIIFDEMKVTYGQLDHLSSQFASALVNWGVQVGDHIGLMVANTPHFPIAYFGILKAGAIVVPMNVLLKAPEVNFYLKDSGATTLVVQDLFAAEAVSGAEGTEAEGRIIAAGQPGADAPVGTRAFFEFLGTGTAPFDTVQTSPDDTAVVLYTSGTTGKPKGAELTHANLFLHAEIACTRLIEFATDDVILIALPLFHSFGQSSQMNPAILGGATMTLQPRFDPDQALAIMRRDKVSIFGGVPTMYFQLLGCESSEEYRGLKLRVAVSGGASMPVEVIREFEERFDCAILEGYGLSETSPTCSFNRMDIPRKVGSIGPPIWGVEMRVVDDNDAVLPQGEVGEIVVRGWNVMKGYLDQPDANREVFKGGWFHTGDLGYADDDGYFFIVDRKKEMIIRGGFNVYPREIEEVLYAHPAVAEAAIIGIPDEKYGEEILAIVSLKTGQAASPEDIQEFVKARVAAYRYPRQVRIVDSLPKGPTGKILKKELKLQLGELVGS